MFDRIISEPLGRFQDEVIFVSDLYDLPEPVDSVITLLPNITYYVTSTLDLMGNRLVSGANTVIVGSSSENSRITSTGLGVGIPLLTITATCPVRHVTFQDVDTCLYVNGDSNLALDWYGVNFQNVPNIGILNNLGNFIFNVGAFLNSQGMTLSGEMGTFAIINSLLQGRGSTGSIIQVQSTANITRRFRIIYTSVIAFGLTVGIDFSATATVPAESYILDTVNFGGGSTYLSGIDVTSNKSLFVNCTNIKNTSINGQLSMFNNTTPTIISNTTDFVKIAGTTIPDDDNEKMLHSNNRLINDAVIQRKYLVTATVSFNSGNNNVCEFAIFDSATGVICPSSVIKTTANSGGRQENVNTMCFVSHSQGDYVEVWAKNTSAATNIIVSELNLIVTQVN